MPDILVIYNPVAGRGRTQAYWPEVERALHEAEVDFVAVPTRGPQDAAKMAERALGVYRAVVAVGGDGTVHEVVNGVARAADGEATIPVGVIPLGNGDDFAKMIPPETAIGEKQYDWRVAVEKIAGMQTRQYDLGRIYGDGLRDEMSLNPHYFMNSMDIGFGAMGVVNFNTIPKILTGFPAYLATVFKTMVRYPLLPVSIKLDDQPPFEQVTAMTAVMNGRCLGDGFWVTPEAVADDGLFDLMVAQGVGRLTILGLVPKFMRGTHVREPVIDMYRAKRVVIESAAEMAVETDGELPYMSAHHLEIDLLPRRLTVIV